MLILQNSIKKYLDETHLAIIVN